MDYYKSLGVFFVFVAAVLCLVFFLLGFSWGQKSELEANKPFAVNCSYVDSTPLNAIYFLDNGTAYMCHGDLEVYTKKLYVGDE